MCIYPDSTSWFYAFLYSVCNVSSNSSNIQLFLKNSVKAHSLIQSPALTILWVSTIIVLCAKHEVIHYQSHRNALPKWTTWDLLWFGKTLHHRKCLKHKDNSPDRLLCKWRFKDNFIISIWCLILERFWSSWCIFWKYILLACQTKDYPCMHKQTKHPLISYCRAFTLKRSAKRQKNKTTEQHQQTSIVIMCQGQRWNRGQKAPFGHMWPVLEFMNSAWWGPRQGYVTAGQQGACRLLKYWGGVMGWEVRETKGEERRGGERICLQGPNTDLPWWSSLCAFPLHWFCWQTTSQ